MRTAIKRTLGTIALMALAAAPEVASAGVKTLTGRVVRFDEESLTVRTKPGEVITVRLVEGTRYVKQVTEKPWQQSTNARRSFLRVGKLVTIEPETGEYAMQARIVRIATQ